jgi:hypothetical protein
MKIIFAAENMILAGLRIWVLDPAIPEPGFLKAEAGSF